MLGRFVLVLVLIAANVFTGVGIVYSKHSLRKEFIELQKLQNQFDELQVEWGRLQLEQSTWLTHYRVEKLAREELGMSQVHKERLVLLESRCRHEPSTKFQTEALIRTVCLRVWTGGVVSTGCRPAAV